MLYDVIIIGCGVIGVVTAYTLAESAMGTALEIGIKWMLCPQSAYALGVEIEEFEELKIGLINYMDGNVLFSGGNYLGEYGVYKNKEMIFRGVLAEDYDGLTKIWSGYEKSKEYVGNYSEGKFHSEGCE